MVLSVLHVISGFERRFGGPTSALIGLTNAEVDAGMEVVIASSYRSGEDVVRHSAEQPLKARHVSIGPCWGSFRWRRGIRAALSPLIRTADVVHIHALWEEIVHQAALEAYEQRKPYVIRPCGMLDPWSLANGAFKKELYLRLRLRRDLRRAALIHCTSNQEQSNVEKLGIGVPSVVEPNGINRSEYLAPPRRGSFRTARLGGFRGPLLLMLSRIDPKKNIEAAIDMLPGLPGVHVAIVGPGPAAYVESLLIRARARMVSDRIHLIGPLQGEQKVEALADADLLILPSFEENFGNVIIEALSTGTPVIVSSEVGLADEVLAGGVGAVAAPTPSAFGAKVGEWLANPDLAAAAKVRIDGFLRERFEWPAIARRWQARYPSLVLAT